MSFFPFPPQTDIVNDLLIFGIGLRKSRQPNFYIPKDCRHFLFIVRIFIPCVLRSANQPEPTALTTGGTKFHGIASPLMVHLVFFLSFYP